jgi:hypothetical protein
MKAKLGCRSHGPQAVGSPPPAAGASNLPLSPAIVPGSGSSTKGQPESGTLVLTSGALTSHKGKVSLPQFPPTCVRRHQEANRWASGGWGSNSLLVAVPACTVEEEQEG